MFGESMVGATDMAAPRIATAANSPWTVGDAQRILGTTRDAFVAMGFDGIVTAWNDAATSMFGYTAGEAMGQPMASLIVPERSRAAHREAVRNFDYSSVVDPAAAPGLTAAPGSTSATGEVVAMHRSGREFPVEITHWCLQVDGHLALYAFIRNISERKGREQELAVRRAREAELTHRTLHDPLTGLANRSLALEHLGDALRRRGRYGGELAVLFVDLDRFKLINDSLGHDAGDELLMVTARRLVGSVRESDAVARIAGDEFVVICPELTDRDQAREVADRILLALTEPVDLAGERVRVRGSVGIAFAESAGETAEDLLRDADAAMYRAKERGRAQVAVFDTDMRSRLRNRLHMEREIAESLERRELEVWYRPFVDLRGGAVAGMQSMIAWRHPRLGVLEPTAFADVAEEVGVMPSIIDWASGEICRQARRWHGETAAGVSIGVDLTARQVTYPSFAPSLAEALRSTGLDAGRFVIGVLPPDGALPARDGELFLALDALRAMGVVVGVIGSGTGCAMLEWMAEAPFDVLKIGPQFGGAVGIRPRADAVIAAMASLGHELGMTVAIDGLATAGQRDRAAELGCDFGQGALFGGMAPPGQAVLAP